MNKESAVPGLAMGALLLTGALALVLAVAVLVTGRAEGAGLFMLAAAVAFGSAVNAMFRR